MTNDHPGYRYCYRSQPKSSTKTCLTTSRVPAQTQNIQILTVNMQIWAEVELRPIKWNRAAASLPDGFIMAEWRMELFRAVRSCPAFSMSTFFLSLWRLSCFIGLTDFGALLLHYCVSCGTAGRCDRVPQADQPYFLLFDSWHQWTH